MASPGIIASAQSGGVAPPPPPETNGIYAVQLAGGVATLAGIGSYSWLNQGSAAIADTGGGVRLSLPADASNQVRGIYWTAPATPYEARALIALGATGNGARAGIGWKDTGTKLQTVHLQLAAGAHQVEGINWSDPQTPDGAAIHVATPARGRAWLLAGHDGTDIYIGISYDGVNFKELFRAAAASAYLTGDYASILFFGNANGGGAFDATLIGLLS